MSIIEKNIPVPPARRVSKYTDLPLIDMEVGDSIQVECHKDDVSKYKALRGRLSYMQKSNSPRMYIMRRIHTGYVRIWRIEDRGAG